MTYTDPGIQHYSPTIATDLNILERHDAAHALAGLEPPTRGSAIGALLAAEPTAEETARGLAEDMLTATDPDQWLEDALAQVQRAHAADALRLALGRHRDVTIKAHADRLITETAAAVKPAAELATKALTKAAAKLPTEGHPLDLAAVVELDATRDMKQAQAALRDLATLAGIHRPLHPGDLPARAVRLLAVVHIPEVPVEPVNRLSGNPVDHDPQRDAVRAFLTAADREGEDRALIGVARGEYDGLRLHLAATPAELHANAARAKAAIMRRSVDAGHPMLRVS